MPIKLLALALFLGVSLPAQTLSKLAAAGYAVVPEPQQVDLLSGSGVPFGSAWSLQIGARVAPGDIAPESLRDLLRERFGLGAPGNSGTLVHLEIQPGSVSPGKATGSDKQAIADQAYRLEIAASGVTITANASG